MSAVITYLLIVMSIAIALVAVVWITMWDDRAHRVRGSAIAGRAFRRQRAPRLTLVVDRQRL